MVRRIREKPMLIYKCEYCGAEVPFDGRTTVCPACGAAFKTGAEPIESTDFDDEPGYDPAEDETPKRAKNTKKKKRVSTAVGILIFIAAFIIFVFFVALVETAKDEIEYGGSSYEYSDFYKEEGHSPNELYTGDAVIEADISDYNVISWSEEPVLQWGEYDFNADTLIIHAKIHNNSEKDIKTLSFSFDIVWKDGSEPKYMSANVHDLFAGQDEYIDDEILIYLPKTYNDIEKIKITEVRISYE
jgi:uncharacterized Zn finger protein (UPF0148 family)